MPAPTLDALLKRGSVEFNKLRQAKSLPADFTGATLTRLVCANADLSQLELTGSEWEHCDLSKLNFRNADLSNAYFHGGRLDDCDFSGANLSGASFEKLKLTRCIFTGAQGLDEVELSDVIQKDVVGLEEEEEEDEEDEDEDAAEPEETSVKLRDLLSKAARRLPLEGLIAEVAKHVTVETGTPAKAEEIRALEAAFEITFPADYRAFLQRFGGLKIVGDKAHALGSFEVFGLAELQAAHQKYLAEFQEWGFNPEWLTVKSGEDEDDEGESLAQRKAKLRGQLKIEARHVKNFFGDSFDAVRVAYQFLLPVMVAPKALHQAVDCVGPDTQMYTVAIESWEVAPPSGTFTSRLFANLENVVVR